ncbi:ubiquitin-like-specific protease 1D [Trifolium pratense]|uniref:ubiquitin-like-specific protease 1D n=1 Tax=Trifolium pratense TaxID=57577 RepID=UPI001E696657|nr:ubiquitin-like-specific protease 1D [Trifolium pratense]
MINAFPPRVLESLDSMDPFLHFLSEEADECVNYTPPRVLESLDSMDPFLHFLSDEAADECVNYNPPRVLESLDSMDAFGNSSASFQSHEFLDKFDVNDFDGVVDLETHVATLENRQHQTELAYFNLEPDECANYSTPPSYVSDIAADATCLHRPTTYYPDFQEPFVYPKGDPDAVCLTKTDVELLNPATYINDTIIDFYILYLKNKMQKQKKPSFHFFNSFFYPKLAGDRKSAFRSVRKWTRKVNLFEKDYIFIPVNFKYHWSLIVICHPALQENTFFATKKVVGKCQKLLQKSFTPTTKKSLLDVAISSVTKSFAAKFNIVAVYWFFATILFVAIF